MNDHSIAYLNDKSGHMAANIQDYADFDYLVWGPEPLKFVDDSNPVYTFTLIDNNGDILIEKSGLTYKNAVETAYDRFKEDNVG